MVEENCYLKNNTSKSVTFISTISCLLFLPLGNTMLAVVIELLHKAFHFCVLEHFMSAKDLEPRMHLSKTSTLISHITENTAYHYKVQLSQIKHQLDATLCRFYFCRVTLHSTLYTLTKLVE